MIHMKRYHCQEKYIDKPYFLGYNVPIKEIKAKKRTSSDKGNSQKVAGR